MTTSPVDIALAEFHKSPPNAAHARKLIQQLKAFTSNLEQYLVALEKMDASKSANGASLRQKTTKPAPQPRSAKRGTPTGLKSAVRALSSKLPSTFTGNDVLEKVHGVEFKGDRKSAVRDALSSLREDGVIKLVEAGKAGKPNKYSF